MNPQAKFHTVAIAGTFDRLHKGHRYFITSAFNLGRRVVIGLTSDNYVGEKSKIKNQKSNIHIKYQKYEDRKKELEEYLITEGLFVRAEIVKIEDVYGPAIGDTDIEALVVTSETLEGAEMVNKKRKELGLKLLKILMISLVMAEDKKRIASTRIRMGEIDRWGRLFVSRITYHSGIAEELRQKLKIPLGRLIKGDPEDLNYVATALKEVVGKANPAMIITVGDEVTRICNEVGITVNLAIVDFRVQREEKYHSLSELGFLNSKTVKTPQEWQAVSHDSPGVEESAVGVNNPSRHITKELTSAVSDAYKGIIKDSNQRIIQVDGEEDLAGVPAILLAPLGSLVIYGQPGEGVVAVEVTEEMKQKLINLIEHH